MSKLDGLFESVATFVLKKPVASLAIPATVGALNFFANTLSALSDGEIDCNELHQLLGSANGIETAILIAIMVALKIKSKHN